MGKYSALARAFWDFGNWYTDLDAQKMCPKTLTSQKSYKPVLILKIYFHRFDAFK